MNTKTYKINVTDDVEIKLIKKLEKIKNKYSSINGFNISWTVENIILETPSRYSKIFPNMKKIITTTKQYTVVVDNPYIKYNGFDYVGMVEKNTKGTFITNNVGGMDQYNARILDIANEDIRCDHCHTNRKRNKAYVFVNTNTDELLMIASTCSEAYFGVSINLNLKNIDSIHNDIKKINVESIESENIFDSFLYSACVYTMINSKQYSVKYDPFKVIELFNFIDSDHKNYNNEFNNNYELMVKSNIILDNFSYEDMMNYYTNLQPKTPFEHNIKMAMFANTVNSRASYKMRAIGVYNYMLYKEKENTVSSSYIGSPKERISITGVVTKVIKRSAYNFYNKLVNVNFVVINSNNNIIITSDYNHKFDNCENKTVSFDCKIKGHSTFRDVKQTEVNYITTVTVE